MIEKSAMKVTIENIKDPHPKKVNQLLKELNMPLLPTQQVTTEETTDNK